MILLSVDPSIANPGAALFDTRRMPAGERGAWTAAAHAYLWAGVYRCPTGELDVARAAAVGGWVAEIVRQKAVEHVVIEVPAEAGSYKERQRRQATKRDLTAASMVKLNRAIGAIAHAAAAAGAELSELPPVDQEAERARGIVSAAIAEAGLVDPRLARDLILMGNEAIHGKKSRHRVLQALLRAAGRRVPDQVDARDAAWLGLQWIAVEGGGGIR